MKETIEEVAETIAKGFGSENWQEIKDGIIRYAVDEKQEETANGTNPVLGEVCPNCKTELSTSYISDARSGKHLFDVRIDFCEICLYIGDADCTNVSR